MNNAVRFYSKGGKTKAIAEAIAKGVGVQAVSITQEETLEQKYDILFLGGAPYANLMAPELKLYAQNLQADKVGKVVLFTTSNWSRRTILTLKKILKDKGIEVANETFFAQAAKIESRIPAAEEFGKKMSK